MPRKAKRFAFYLPYEDAVVGTQAFHAPTLLPLIGEVKRKGHKADFFTKYGDLKKAVRKNKYDAIGISIYDYILVTARIFKKMHR